MSTRQREALKDGFVVGVSEFGCLQIYPAANFQRILKEIELVNLWNSHRSDFHDEVVGQAVLDIEFDKAERIYIPTHLRKRCDIGSRVRVVGEGIRYLVWKPEELEIYRSDKKAYRRQQREAFFELRRLMLEEERERQRLEISIYGDVQPGSLRLT